MRGEIHLSQLGVIEVVDMFEGKAELVEEPVVPQHGHFIAAELHVRFDAVYRIGKRPVKSGASVFRRFFIGAAMGEDQSLFGVIHALSLPEPDEP